MRAQFPARTQTVDDAGWAGEGFGAVSLGVLWMVSRPTFFYHLIWFSCPNGSTGIQGFVWPTLHRAPWGQTQAAVFTPQRTCCPQGALTEQKKPYGSACDKLKCVKWLFSGVERSKDSFVGKQDEGVEGALLVSRGLGSPSWDQLYTVTFLGFLK